MNGPYCFYKIQELILSLLTGFEMEPVFFNNKEQNKIKLDFLFLHLIILLGIGKLDLFMKGP